MAPVGWGADPTKVNNVVTSGTSAEDVRKIWGALYNPGIITGAVVTPSTTNRSYTVTTGVAVIPIATGEHVMAPIPYTVVPAVAATNRTDIIYAKQNLPSVEGNSDVVVGRAETLPANSIALSRFIVEATDTTAAAGVRTGGIDYSVPYGSTGKILFQYTDTANADIIGTATYTAGNGSFHLPTDRRINIGMRATLNSKGAIGFDSSKYCDVIYQIFVDGGAAYTWTTGGLNQARETYDFDGNLDLAAGTHTIYYTYKKYSGAGTPTRHHWGANGWPGTWIKVTDAGVID